MADYSPNHRGTGQLLRSPEMQMALLMYAERIKNRAEAIAPVGQAGDPHRGRYRTSFRVRVHSRGGATRDRAEAIVSNDSPEAVFVEWGTAGDEPYHILLRAAVEGGRV